ncbi:TPA: hypothetical protein DIV48_01370 [Candidatus Kaiserbacteria bacterium]|nr:hypothetical protein [Candidatus Kaiserbacteria bacterium]
MVELVKSFLPYAVLVSHVLLLVLFLAVIFRKSWGKKAVAFLNSRALKLCLIISLGAIVGSLFYSEIVGYEACVLCWWQRVFLYPQLVLFTIALWKNDRSVFGYSFVLSSLAGIVALYQAYVNWGGASLLPCTAAEGACAKIFVMEFGYITIPVMSLTVVFYLLLLAWINRLYRNENRNA